MDNKSDTSIEQHAELDPFTHNAKSSVEIKQTTRGPTFKIKVVTGENGLIEGLTDSAITSYRKIQTELNIEGGKINGQ